MGKVRMKRPLLPVTCNNERRLECKIE